MVERKKNERELVMSNFSLSPAVTPNRERVQLAQKK